MYQYSLQRRRKTCSAYQEVLLDKEIKTYIVCRSHTQADAWAQHQELEQLKVIIITEVDNLRGLPHTIQLVFLELVTDSLAFRESVGQAKIYWPNSQIVKI